MTWLNAMNDRGMGRGAKVVSGTIRDSLHMVDVIFGLDGGDLPEIVVSDTGSYSDVVFGLLELLGISYRPALADLPDQKGWRISPSADSGPLRRRLLSAGEGTAAAARSGRAQAGRCHPRGCCRGRGRCASRRP
ncbi:Tn3 family transposase [Streptosporangium canum]|uniref:Tn3 family transposase n=1 Tax=Streptosporangium canum TaxID=324952 RepID=UPI0037BD1C23